jgi:hypothetical protein
MARMIQSSATNRLRKRLCVEFIPRESTLQRHDKDWSTSSYDVKRRKHMNCAVLRGVCGLPKRAYR